MKIFEMQEKAFKAQRQIYKKYKKIPGMKEKFQIIEISFDIFENLLKIPFEKNDIFAVAVREIVLRAHKMLQAATLNATAGIEIPAMSLLRDLIEIEFLLRYFEISPDEVSKWWYADRETRLRKYSPKKLREKITKEFPKLKRPMESDYFGHCEIATHPTPISLKLQSEFENDFLFPPSRDLMFVWIVVTEISLHAARVAKFVAYLGDSISPQSDFKTKFDKLKKVMSDLPVDKELARYLLHRKLDRSKKKYQAESKK